MSRDLPFDYSPPVSPSKTLLTDICGLRSGISTHGFASATHNTAVLEHFQCWSWINVWDVCVSAQTDAFSNDLLTARL